MNGEGPHRGRWGPSRTCGAGSVLADVRVARALRGGAGRELRELVVVVVAGRLREVLLRDRGDPVGEVELRQLLADPVPDGDLRLDAVLVDRRAGQDLPVVRV